ncbi:hypothetical protein FRC09_018045 [Ceratobasidium sp. 395]|nr:hypothetical protein FRC09_018045 [Ceratobasidium sp. 395]
MASSQPRDYRRMLYRLDLGTKYESIPALVQHMMDETVLDGILEVRMWTSSNTPGQSSQAAQLRVPSTFISFRREGREVNAVALYGPHQTRPPSSSASPTLRAEPTSPTGFALEVKKRFAPRTTLVWVFTPLVQKILTEGASTVLFECRSYLAGSDVVREVRAAEARATAEQEAATREATARAAAEREMQYQQQLQMQMRQQQMQQQPLSYQGQYAPYDPSMRQWPQDPYAAQQSYQPHPNVVAPALNPHATFPLADPMYLDYSGNPANLQPQQYSSPPTSYDQAASTPSPARHSTQRSSGSPRSGSQTHPRTHKSTSSSSQSEKEEDPAMELLTRRAPYKRMVGYAGKQHDGSLAVYELADAVAATAFTDGVPGMGLAGVEAMGNIGRQASPSIAPR